MPVVTPHEQRDQERNSQIYKLVEEVRFHVRSAQRRGERWLALHPLPDVKVRAGSAIYSTEKLGQFLNPLQY